MNRVAPRSRKKKAWSLLQAGRFQEACDLYKVICKRNSEDAEAWFLCGALSGQLGQFDNAIDCCRKAVGLKPDYLEAWYNLAQAYMHCDRTAEAITAYRKAIEIKPDYVEAHFNLGYALEQSGDYAGAIQSYRKAIDITPDYVEAYCNLGNLMNNINQGSREDGIAYLRLALRIDPSYSAGWIYLGRALHQTGQLDEALDSFDTVLDKEPGNIETISAKALVYEKQGEFDKAYSLLQPLLGNADANIAAAFAAVASRLGKSDEAIALLEVVLQRASLNAGDSRTLHLRLGRLLDRKGDYDAAFDHFRRGNALKRSGYDADAILGRFDEIRDYFSESRMAGLPRATNQSQTPVFIVGMPRSGTTLVEQILDSHPGVFGAGELTFMEDSDHALQARVGKRNLAYPAYLQGVTSDVLDDVANKHLAALSGLAPDRLRIVDKMPHNFRYLALIELLFPAARVIHCSRHPLDTCLSIYSYDFNAMHAYSTDMNWLGQYYRKYMELMAHWKQVLRIPLLEVSYEALIADQEAVTRKLLAFCGLSWDERCLDFYNNRRSVNTISYDQVRQPINDSSVARWRHYEQHLGALKQALGIDA
jgi:tetratricopeptide (TPR) repeat protein